VVIFISAASGAFAGDFTLNNKLTFLSEYYSRGFSQTRGSPAPQFMTTLSHSSGVFAGAFISKVEFLDGEEADAELDYFLEYNGFLDNWYYRAGLIYYTFPNADSSFEYDFWELDLALGYNFGPVYTELNLKRSPDHYADSGEMRYVTFRVHVPVTEQLKLKNHIAHRHIEDNVAFFNIPDSYDWETGFEYMPVSYLGIVGKYVDSSLSRSECLGTDNCEERIILGINYYF
jgi:uncharacterized protein (TIGR02001 family)